MFLPESKWTPPSLGDLPSWKGVKRIAVDIETCDPELLDKGPGVRRGGFIAGVAFAFEDGPGFYLPIAHEGGDNMDREGVLRYLRDQAAEFDGVLVGTNLTYDLDFLAEVGIVFPKVAWIRDVLVAEPLIDELQMRYNLNDVAKRYNLTGKDDELMAEAAQAYGLKGRLGKSIWKLPARYVADYAVQDTYLPLKLLRYQEREIEQQDLQNIFDLESRLLPVMLRMRRRGVRFSHERLDRVEQWSIAEEKKALEIIYHHTNERIALGDVWSPEPFARALRTMGVTVPETAKGKPSITAEFLGGLNHDAAHAMARARKVNKVRSTFVASVRDYAIGDRIHTVINQLRREKEDDSLGGAAFGRCSSEHPNMQQQPARDKEIGPMWRSVYIPDEGGIWGCLDYSQQEPRLLTHYAELTGCQGAARAAQKYRDDPLTDNHTMMAELTGLPRKQAKNVFLGLCYGMGQAKLCHDVGLPTEWMFSEKFKRMIEVAGPEGKKMLDTFNRRAPYVRQMAKKCEARAKEMGYIVTLLGRRCRFPIKDNGEYDWTYKALNRLIQGGSADQMKAAMVAADDAGFPIQLQVHDELDLTVSSVAEAAELAGLMRTAVTLNVPSRVDNECGPSWGEIIAA